MDKKYVPVKAKKDVIDFEEATDARKQTKKVTAEGSSESESIPLYLAISLPKSLGYLDDFKNMLEEGAGILKDKFGPESEVLLTNCESLMRLAKSTSGKKQKDGWRFVPEFHIDCAFLGRDEDKADLSPVFRTFRENVKMDIYIQAFVIVPDKIVTAICFPDQSV
mgnify:CR=1 FL=1